MVVRAVRKQLPIVLAILLLVVSMASVTAAPPGSVNVQILAFNDFHGTLEPPSGSGGRVGSINAGGVEYLATHINNLRAANPYTVVVSAGDMIGASPLVSALFHDEPTIEAFNAIGVDYNTVGNHEFDEGAMELVRMQEGGCHPVDGCQDGDDFAGADFRYLAANVVWEKNDKPLFPAYKIKSFEGAKIAFIGIAFESTPTIVTPSGVSGLKFLDEVETVNALVPGLKKQGIETIVVLLHDGGAQVPSTSPHNSCVGVAGPFVDLVTAFDDEVDVVITGHTHNAYNCVIDGKVVTGAMSSGRIVSDIDLTISRASGELTAVTANNVIVTRDVPADPAMTALIQKYKTAAAPLANRVIGNITADVLRVANGAGESALGDVIADSQFAATADPAFGGAVAAFMNSGGIRADLLFQPAAGKTDLPGQVTYEEAFTVQPFGNSLVTLTVTGEQIDTMLEQQFVGCGTQAGYDKILQPSVGFTYSYSASAAPCSKIDIASIMINGAPINPTGTYRITVNNFLADGGDNFTVLKQGYDRLGGDVDLDALEKYLTANSPVPPGPQNRITKLP